MSVTGGDGRERQRLTGKLAGGGRRRATAEAIPGGGACTKRTRTAKLWTVRTDSSGLRSWRGLWLRVRLGERNTMVVLHARNSQQLGSYRQLLNVTKLNLKHGGFRLLCAAVDGDAELDDVLACGGSGEDSWWQHAVVPIFLSLFLLLSLSLLLLSNF